MASSKKSTAVVQPNLGLYLDRAKLAMSPRMLQDGLNFRVYQGRLSNLNIGYTQYGTFQLNGPVLMIANFLLRGGSEKLVFATPTDLYQYVNSTTVSFLTPRYETGTVSRTAHAVTGSGTAWTTNISVGDQIYFGATGQVSPGAAWDTVTAIADDTHLTTTGSGTVAGGTAYTVRHLFTGKQNVNIWQWDVFVNASPSTQDELWMTNGIDPIVRWNGSDTQVSNMSTGLGFTCATLRVYDNMMMFANLTQGGVVKPTDFINSDVGQPQNAGSASSGVSGQYKAHPGVEAIMRLEPIGDNLAIYSLNSRVTLTQFVGSPLFFIFRQIITNIGIIGPNYFANFGQYHEFITPADQYYFDGAQVKPNNSHVWREILRQEDPNRILGGYAHFDFLNADLQWVVPLTADTNANPSITWQEHYLENPGPGFETPYSKRSFPFTATGYFFNATGLTWNLVTTQWQNTSFRWNDRAFAAQFPLNLAGDQNGYIYSLNVAQDANGTALNSFVTFGRRALGDGRIRGLLTRVYPFVTPLSTALNVTVQMADSADGNPLIIDTQSFNQAQPEGGHFTTHYRRGRFFEVKFGSTGPSQPWEIKGYDTDVRPGGKR
jgi:hypothetical protein